jgi:transposase
MEERKGEDVVRGKEGGSPAVGGENADPLAPRGRWSTKRKQAVVMRMLRGEPLDALSRELGVEIYRLERWRDKAFSGMESGLREREGDPLQVELDSAKRLIGELSMENELLRKRCEAKESFRKGRSRR